MVNRQAVTGVGERGKCRCVKVCVQPFRNNVERRGLYQNPFSIVASRRQNVLYVGPRLCKGLTFTVRWKYRRIRYSKCVSKGRNLGAHQDSKAWTRQIYTPGRDRIAK